MGDREGAESPGALGMHTALWNHLAVEVRHLLKKPDVLEQRRTPFASCCDVLVVVDWGAECRGELLIHIVLSVVLLAVKLVSKQRQPVFSVAPHTTWSNS